MLLAIQKIEIDELVECFPQGRRVVDAERIRHSIKCEEHRWHPGREETRYAKCCCNECAKPVKPHAQRIDLRRDDRRQAGRDPIPEFAQPFEPALGGVACDQRTVDRTDRHARHPVRRDSLFRHAFIDTRLVRAERATAL